jgi:hypothetical protein
MLRHSLGQAPERVPKYRNRGHSGKLDMKQARSKVRVLGFLVAALLPALGLAQCPSTDWAQFCGPVSDVGQKQFNACMAKCQAEWGPSKCGGISRPANSCWSYTCTSGAWKQQSPRLGAACRVGATTGACNNTGTCIPSGNTGGQGVGDIPYFNATVGNPVQTPKYVNLYWDDRWDLDNPSLPKASIDAFTAAMAGSSYFTMPVGSGLGTHLSEYGVVSASFGGGFLPAPPCTQRSPSRPGWWDPVAPSIMGFLQCEIHNAGVPTDGNVIYNIILPSYAIEQDVLGVRSFCRTNGATAWHFHDTPYDPVMTAGLILTAGLGDILALLAGVNNGPVWTITMTSTECNSGPSVFTTNLLHEMVEAATDPFPPVSVILSGSGEIADECESSLTGDPVAGTTTSPFAVPASVPTLPPGGDSVAFATSSIIAVPAFWSNEWQHCWSGFADLSAPAPPIVTILSGQGGTLSMTIAASNGGFGLLPPSFTAGNTVTLPYIGLQDLTQGWQAGNSLDSDQVTLNVSWPSSTSPSPPTIAVTGVGRPGTDFTMKSGDQLAVWVCNPQSGNCSPTGAISAPPGPFLPNLAVALAVFQSQVIAPYVTFSVDGKAAGSLFGDGSSTGWMTLGIGSHTVSASVPADTSGMYKVSYTGACTASGVVTLNEGDNRTCDIRVMSSLTLKSTGCATNETCCEAGVIKCSICMRLPPHGSCP